MDFNFWKNKKVFITGHTGFKGSWLCLCLQQWGAEVCGYSLPPPTQPSLFEIAQVHEGITHTLGDIRDFDSLKSALQKNQPEIVMHMAAQSLVRPSYENPLETYSTNVMGTVHLLEAIRQTKSVKSVVIVTSDKCYENREWEWGYRENETLGGYDPYSSSKACAEIVTSALRNSFFNLKDYPQHGVAIASARAGNVIGGGDWSKDRLIPDILQSFIQKKPAIIRNPKAIRPWQHVLEPLSGYLELAQKLYQEGPRFAEAWNFGPSDEEAKPVSWLADQLTILWGKQASWKQDASSQPHEAHSLKLDSSKAKIKLGWRPKWKINQSLEATTDWYRRYFEQEDMKKFTLHQINQYVN